MKIKFGVLAVTASLMGCVQPPEAKVSSPAPIYTPTSLVDQCQTVLGKATGKIEFKAAPSYTDDNGVVTIKGWSETTGPISSGHSYECVFKDGRLIKAN